MLTRFRIEVEEKTVAECVEALAKYQHAIQAMEADRYRNQWPVTLTAQTSEDEGIAEAADVEYPTESYWDMPMDERCFFQEELGTEVTEEVIEYDAGIPGYRGRRVVRLQRVDMRSDSFLPMKPYFEFHISTGSQQLNSGSSS